MGTFQDILFVKRLCRLSWSGYSFITKLYFRLLGKLNWISTYFFHKRPFLAGHRTSEPVKPRRLWWIRPKYGGIDRLFSVNKTLPPHSSTSLNSLSEDPGFSAGSSNRCMRIGMLTFNQESPLDPKPTSQSKMISWTECTSWWTLKVTPSMYWFISRKDPTSEAPSNLSNGSSQMKSAVTRVDMNLAGLSVPDITALRSFMMYFRLAIMA